MESFNMNMVITMFYCRESTRWIAAKEPQWWQRNEQRPKTKTTPRKSMYMRTAVMHTCGKLTIIFFSGIRTSRLIRINGKFMFYLLKNISIMRCCA